MRTEYGGMHYECLLSLDGECGDRTCLSAARYVLTRHVCLHTQHTDVGTVWSCHWTDPARRNIDQVDVMKYNSANGNEYADAVSRVMKNKVRDVHQPNNVCPSRSMLESKHCSLMQFSLKMLGRVLA
jgi:hypothetical protein